MSKNKPAPYHLEIQTHRKNPYGLLRNSYWEDGKVRHKTISRITGLSLEQLRAVQAAIQGKTVGKESFKFTGNREYGASRAGVAIVKALGLHFAIFSRPSEEWVRVCLALIVGRLVYAGSKLSLSHCGAFSTLWELCGINGDIDVNICYAAMDRLLARQDAIQKSLAMQHLQNGTVVFYDITNCYVEGEYEDSNLVDFGYNRDRKLEHEQVVISLMCSKEGCPVAVDVFRGNIKDETTVLLDKIKELKTNYGLEKVIFVGDRGMVMQSNYGKIDHETVKVISALTHVNLKELCQKGAIHMEQFDEKNIVEFFDGNLRYGLCKNTDMAAKESATRTALLKKTTDELDKIAASTKECKQSKGVRAAKVMGKYNMGKFIIIHDEKEYFAYSLNETKIQQEASMDGCYIIYTDLAADDLSVIETVKSYKSLLHIEQAFRNMKTVRLEIRPIFHKTDDRIRCHVFICMLAYYLMWHMKQRLRPFMDADGVGAHRKYTFDYIMQCLKNIMKGTVDFCGTTSNVVTPPSEEQSRILQLLGVKL